MPPFFSFTRKTIYEELVYRLTCPESECYNKKD